MKLFKMTPVILWLVASLSQAMEVDFPDKSWREYELRQLARMQDDETNGLSYMISGGLALLGGIAGQGATSDPLEQTVYTLFQSIGVASVGYGAYKWKIGDDERKLYLSLRRSTQLSDSQKFLFLKTYYGEKQSLGEQEKVIRAVTHALIAGLNFYNATQQKQEGIKNTLNFIGGANLLASISFAF
jgi:hypothetical protein